MYTAASRPGCCAVLASTCDATTTSGETARAQAADAATRRRTGCLPSVGSIKPSRLLQEADAVNIVEFPLCLTPWLSVSTWI
jgi:hypothetical protein